MPDTSAKSLEQLLGHTASPPWWRRKAPWILAAVALATGAGLWWWQGQATARAAPRYVTEPLAKGDLHLSVTANGKLQPTRTVSLGSELSGTVARVQVDVNDPVKKGQVLVELDTAKLQDQIAIARATRASAQASVLEAVAAVKEAQASLQRLEEVFRLSGGKVPAATEMDSARAALAKAQAAETSARASVASAQATLSTNETNLAKASIRSPIDGVILTRAVDPGVAVAASLQAVTLFTIAEDLRHLQLSVNVDEADVGQVAVGQASRFTVSAWPGRNFPATITRVAYGSTTTDNVVTYTTLMDVANEDLSLRPGMTATATISATERKAVLLVPNRALRFTPSVASGDASGGASPGTAGTPGPGSSGTTPGSGSNSGSGSSGLLSKLMPRPPGMSQNRKQAGTSKGGIKQIWVLEQNQPKALSVQTGLSDGRVTEVQGEGLREGLAVIVEQSSGARP